MSLTWQAISLQDKTRAHKVVSAVSIHGMNGKGILAAIMLGKVEITLQMMRKITEQALYGHDKSFANSSSDSHGVFHMPQKVAGKI